MSLLDQLTEEMKKSLKAGDARRLSVVRLLISAIKYAQVDKADLDDQGMIEVLRREAKKRRESITAYEGAGKPERAADEAYELTVIQEYLPTMMSVDEVRLKAQEILGDESFANPGIAIGKVMGQLKGLADGGVVSNIVQEILQSR